MSNKARKAAFSVVGETCPYVDSAFYDMVDELEELLGFRLNTRQQEAVFEKCKNVVKEQTTSLRDALILAYEEKEDSESDLKDRIYALEERIQELENQIG